MKLLRAATLTVADLKRAENRYAEFLDYRTVEAGQLDAALAKSWGAPKSAGAPYCVMKPASNTPIYLASCNKSRMSITSR
jgi:hypothetical protein